MKVKCSGEIYGEITSEECLECALRSGGDQPCGYGYRLLKSIFATQEVRPDIHVTDLTGCLLKAYYDKKEPAARYVHDMLALWLGIVVHEAIDINDEHVQSEIHVEALGIKGRLDAEYEDGRIEDAKTTRWMVPAKLPYGSHEEQVNIYNILRGNGGKRLQIQMIDLSGPSKCRKCKVIMVKFNGAVKCPSCDYVYEKGHLGAMLVDIPVADRATMTQHISERRCILAEALENDKPPEPEPGFLCGYCPHQSCPWNDV